MKLRLIKPMYQDGFTIVELLVVIVVIGILAAITIVSYTGIQVRAQTSKIKHDLTELSKVIQIAQQSSSKTLLQITTNNYTAYSCDNKPDGTDFAALSKSDACWTDYLSALDKISTASGTNIRNLVDPLGRPYAIDENEGEAGGCIPDSLIAYAQPHIVGTGWPNAFFNIPLSGYTGCS